MNLKFFSLVAVFVVGGGLMIFQATRQGASPVLIPSEILARGPGVSLERVRVAGRVSETPYQYETTPEIKLSFLIEDPKHAERGTVPVVYRGIKPDLFTGGRDVIIDGEYKGNVVYASSLLTQCPSKYEPPDPEQKYKNSSAKNSSDKKPSEVTNSSKGNL